jgi:eukaryotic-like serine/threonine-protein kinase
MDSQTWQQLEDIFHRVVGLPPERRGAYLDEACGDDDELRRRVEQLIEADTDEQRERAFDTPALGTNFRLPPAGDLQSQTLAPMPARIGPYRVTRHLATGGMGGVYLAERDDGTFEQTVAIKLISARYPSPEQLERFRRERQTLANLTHPHIAQLHGGGTTDEGLPYIVMEYVDGRRIDAYCGNERLALRQVLALYIKVCRAVQYAHQNLIIHRDLKPSNVLVTTDGEPRLLDFGIAKALGPEQDQDSGGATLTTPMLTPEYASPEQVRQERITTASDVYALGVILYELLAGQRPYRVSTGSPGAVERTICETMPLRPSVALGTGDEPRQAVNAIQSERRWRRQLRGDLDNIALMALRKEPHRRYQTAGQLADDIEDYLLDRVVSARGDSTNYRLRKFVCRNRVVVAAVSLIILVLAAAVLVSGLLAHQAHQDRIAAERAGQAEYEQRLRAEEAERQAAVDAVHARDVSDFLIELFNLADPYLTREEELTARDLVARGSQRVETELVGQPLRQAAMLTALGQVRMKLGEYQVAHDLLRRALQLQQSQASASALDTAQMHRWLGVALAHLGSYEESLAESRLALAILKDADADPVSVGEVLDAMAGVHSQIGEFEEAHALYSRVLSLYGSTARPDQLRIASVHNGLAFLHWEKGEFAAAEESVHQALEIRREHLGERDPTLAGTIQDMGAILHMQGKLDEAEKYYREGLEVMSQALGDEHPVLLSSRQNLAALAMDRGDADAAADLYEDVLAQMRHTFGEKHPDVAGALCYLGVIEDARGNADEAILYLRQAADIQRNALPEDHPELATTLSLLGDILSQTGRPTEGEPVLRESLRIRIAALGDAHWQTAVSRGMLGDCYTAVGRYEEAELLLKGSLEVIRAAFAPEHEQMVLGMKRLVRLYETWGRVEQAHSYREELDRIRAEARAREATEENVPQG